VIEICQIIRRARFYAQVQIRDPTSATGSRKSIRRSQMLGKIPAEIPYATIVGANQQKPNGASAAMSRAKSRAEFNKS
jgi:hypothetical protein